MVASSKVLRTGRDSRQIHSTSAHAYANERHHHDTKRPAIPSSCIRWRPTLVNESRQKVAETESDCREYRKRTWSVSITDEAENGYEKVKGDFGDYRYDVDAVLGVVEAVLEEGTVEGVGCYGSGA